MSINDDLSRLDDLVNIRKRVTIGDHAALECVKEEVRLLKTQRDGYATEISRLEQEREWWTAVNKELLPYQERFIKLQDGLRAPLELLHGIDYEEGSRIDRAVVALEELAEANAARLRPDWKDYLESRTGSLPENEGDGREPDGYRIGDGGRVIPTDR